jgi:hypothetical protein
LDVVSVTFSTKIVIHFVTFSPVPTVVEINGHERKEREKKSGHVIRQYNPNNNSSSSNNKKNAQEKWQCVNQLTKRFSF